MTDTKNTDGESLPGKVWNTISYALRGVANGASFSLTDKMEAWTESLKSGTYTQHLAEQTALDNKGGAVYKAGVAVGAFVPTAKMIKIAGMTVDAIRAGGLLKMGDIASSALGKIPTETFHGGEALTHEFSKMVSESNAEFKAALEKTHAFIEAHPGLVAPVVYGSSVVKGSILAGVSLYMNRVQEATSITLSHTPPATSHPGDHRGKGS